MERKNVIIIGAGIGGLCCGIRLLHAGYKVLILEKTQACGGVAQTIHLPHSSLPFDSFASIFIHPNEYAQIFKDVGLSYQDYYETMPLTNLYKVFYKDGTQFTLNRNYLCEVQSFETTFQDSFEAYSTYVQSMYSRYISIEDSFLTKPFVSIKDFVNPITLLKGVALHPYISVSYYLNYKIKNTKLREFLSFQTFYMGFPPQKMPYLYATIPAVTQTLGLIHVKGGMGAYVHALEKAFYDLGGKMLYKHSVQNILIENNRAYGVLCKNKKIEADIIVSNADYRYTVTQLLSYSNAYMNFSKSTASPVMSCSVFMLHLVLSRPLPMLNIHNIYINDHINEEFKATAKGHLPITPPLYIYYPGAIDENFKTDEEFGINMMLRVPNLSSQITWNTQTISTLRTIFLEGLSEITGIKNIHQYIVTEGMSTPLDLRNQFNCAYGAAFGLAPTLFQSIMFRPQPISKSISGLYFVGSSIHPGNGVSIVMKGAKLTTEEILKRS